MNILPLLVLALAVASTSAFTVCRPRNIDSLKYKYAKVEMGGTITAMKLTSKRSDSDCKSGDSFGFSGNDAWVDKGCRATFVVCFDPKEVTCSSKNYKQKSCGTGNPIKDLWMIDNISNTKCVAGVNYWFVGSDIKVDNGCRAKFAVGF